MNTVEDEHLEKEAEDRGENWLGEKVPEFNTGSSNSKVDEIAELETKGAAEPEAEQVVESVRRAIEPEMEQASGLGNEQQLAGSEVEQLNGLTSERQKSLEDMNKQECHQAVNVLE